MNLKLKAILSIGLMLLVTVISISTVAIINIRNKGNADIKVFEDEELKKTEEALRDVVDIAYSVIETNYNKAEGEVDINNVLKILEEVRYDEGRGYLWVTDNTLPFPKMIMYGINPSFNGKVVADRAFNVTKDKTNIFAAEVDVANRNGGGFVEYSISIPPSQRVIGQDSIQSKMSYSKLFEPLGWVISTGVITDGIYDSIEQMSLKNRSQINSIVIIILVIAVTLLVVGILLTYYFIDRVLKVIYEVKWRLKALSLGQEVPKLDVDRKDEVGEMTSSLNMLVDGADAFSNFALEVGKGNMNFDFKPRSEEDITGNELLKMRDNLKKNMEEEKRRNWINEGQSKFSDLLRRNNDDIDLLCEAVITSYVEYMKASVGTIFLLEGEGIGQYLEMKATYAYDRIKFVKQKVDIGAGLLGQSVLEKESNYLTDIPENYVMIKSGLGDAQPTSVLMTPLMVDGEVLGVIEIASFNTLQDYEIEFAEQLCSDIGAVISAVRINEKTKNLLEESQMMSEQMKAQEEEMRQNMEELAATQEEMMRKQVEMEKLLEQKEQELSELKGGN